MNPQQPYTPQPNGSAPQPEQQPPQPNAPAAAPYVPYYATQAASHGAQDYGYGAYNPATQSQPTQPPYQEQPTPSSPQPQAAPYQPYQQQPHDQPAASYGTGQSYHYAPQPEQQPSQPSQQLPTATAYPSSSQAGADSSQGYASAYPSPSQPTAQPYQPQSGGYNGQAYANPQQPLGATAMAATDADLGAASEPDTSFPVDYLNEIAPKQQPVQMNRFAVFGLIGGVLLLAFSAVMMMVNSQPNYTKQAQTTLARIETLQAATKEQQSRLTENELSSMNTTLTTSLGSMGTELKSSLKDAKIKTELVGDAKKTEKAYSDKLSKTLEDAYLTGALDRVYAREMSYQLSILKSYLQKLKTASGNRKAIADYVATNSKTLDAATKSFSNFTSTK
jgi:ataxin-2 homolog